MGGKASEGRFGGSRSGRERIRRQTWRCKPGESRQDALSHCSSSTRSSGATESGMAKTRFCCQGIFRILVENGQLRGFRLPLRGEFGEALLDGHQFTINLYRAPSLFVGLRAFQFVREFCLSLFQGLNPFLQTVDDLLLHLALSRARLALFGFKALLIFSGLRRAVCGRDVSLRAEPVGSCRKPGAIG